MSNSSTNVPAESGLAVTRWLVDLQQGDQVAARRLWDYVEPRLMQLGRSQFRTASSTCYDEDDLAQSAFHALCAAIQEGRYQALADRGEIWRLLSKIALNKFRNRTVYESAERRGGSMRRANMESLLDSESSELCAEQKTLMQEECERLLAMLERNEIKHVALLKVEGYTNEEIADALNCTRRTVQRRLEFIRSVWSRELEACD